MKTLISLQRLGITMLFMTLLGIVQPAFAGSSCIHDGEPATMIFQLPASLQLESDTAVGTIVFEQTLDSGEIKMTCSSVGNKYKGYTSLTDADARSDVLEGVYQTNVPGIGIRMAQAQDRNTSYTSDDIIIPMHFYSYGGGAVALDTVFHAAMQLVVTGKVEEGYLDTSRLTSEEKYGSDVVAQLLVSPTSVHIQTNTCNLADKNIYVPLKTVHASDFGGQYSDILTDGGFKIEITDCHEGTQIDYQFTSAGSTGVTNGNILDIATGDGAASGVGIQILDNNNTVLNFDQTYTAISSTRANEVAEIPLQARYIKTGDVKAGKVNAVATFEVFYR